MWVPAPEWILNHSRLWYTSTEMITEQSTGKSCRLRVDSATASSEWQQWRKVMVNCVNVHPHNQPIGINDKHFANEYWMSVL